MSFNVEMSDFGAFSERMRQAPEIIKQEMIIGVDRATLAGSGQSKRLVGKQTRTLARSLTPKPATYAGGTVTGSWGTNVLYARIHEEGRGPVEARPGKMLRFTIKGKVLFRKRVGPAKGRFYMRDARKWLEPQLQAEFRAVAVRIIRRLEG